VVRGLLQRRDMAVRPLPKYEVARCTSTEVPVLQRVGPALRGDATSNFTLTAALPVLLYSSTGITAVLNLVHVLVHVDTQYTD
jgi:hypothetical protein